MNINSYLQNSAIIQSRSLAYLETIFPQQVSLPVLKAGHVMGMAQQTVKNKVHKGKFPVPTFKVGGRRMCLKSDVAAYLDALSETTPKPKRGARTKVERITSQKAAEGGSRHG